MNTISDIFKTIENHQRSAIQAIGAITADCNQGSKQLFEIGDQLVYLKYYAACCFRVEKDAMIQFGYIQHENNRKNHDNVLEDLNGLLKQFAAPIAETTAARSALFSSVVTALAKLQDHIAKHNRELITFLGKRMEDSTLSKPLNSAQQTALQQELAQLDSYKNKSTGRAPAGKGMQC
jgi:hemerythrin